MARHTTGDGVAEVIVGRGVLGNAKAGASVGIYSVASGFSLQASAAASTPTEIKTIPLSESVYRYGARVAATDINFDGIADIIVGAGPLGHNGVQILDGETGSEISQFVAFNSTSKLGVWTAAGAPVLPRRFD